LCCRVCDYKEDRITSPVKFACRYSDKSNSNQIQEYKMSCIHILKERKSRCLEEHRPKLVHAHRAESDPSIPYLSRSFSLLLPQSSTIPANSSSSSPDPAPFSATLHLADRDALALASNNSSFQGWDILISSRLNLVLVKYLV
jgi:hypothetical protein